MKWLVAVLIMLVISFLGWLFFAPTIIAWTSALSGEAPARENALRTGSITDNEGIEYKTVFIGGREWMAENVRRKTAPCSENRSVTFTDGGEVGPGVRFFDGSPRSAYLNNLPRPGYGLLYNYAAVRECDLCPPGFKVPTRQEIQQLIDFLGGGEQAGLALAVGGTSGFNALLAGRIDDDGSVLNGSNGMFWTITSDTSAYSLRAYELNLQPRGRFELMREDARVGNSLRCVRGLK